MTGRAVPPGPSGFIHLASTPDFSLGGLAVRPSLHRVGVGGQEESVEPRVMQALIALAQAAGAVVSRDALTDRCWGGRIVGEDAINRCIAKVRRVADATNPPAFVIETVPKVGYRLKAQLPAAEPPDPTAPSTLPAPAHLPAFRARLNRSIVGYGWIAAGLALAAAAIAPLHRLPRQWIVASSRPLLPALDNQSSPSISPDGSMVAFTGAAGGHGRIYVIAAGGGQLLPVSAPNEDADNATWSSDGTHLAYVVAGSNAVPCHIMVASIRGGAPVPAGSCLSLPATTIAWQPGTPYLFFTDHAPVLEGQMTGYFTMIYRLNTLDGRTEQVTSPTNPSDSDSSPRVSPDGTWLAYLRDRGLSGGPTLRLRRLRSSEEREIACDPGVRSFDWSADSRLLIANVPSRTHQQIIAYSIGGKPGYQVYAGAQGIQGLSIGPHGMLAAEMVEGRSVLARASLTPRAAPDILDPAPGQVAWPAFASDGTLSFVSDRSGHVALWVRSPNQPARELPTAPYKDIERPVWSPDGTRLAFFEAWNGVVTVHVLTREGRELVAFQVPSVGYGMPNWTPDGTHLLMFDKRILRVVSIDLAHPADREPVEDKLWDGTIEHDGATYTASGTIPGIWQLGGTPRLVTANYAPGQQPRLTFLGKDVLLPDEQADGSLHILAQPLQGGPPRLAFYAPAAEDGTPFAVDPRSGSVLYVSNVAVQAHIDILTLSLQ